MNNRLNALADDTHKLAQESCRVAAATRKIAVSNRFLAVALVVLALSVAAGMVLVRGELAGLGDKIRPSAAEEQRRLRDKMAADEKVDEILAKMAEDLDGDRALAFLAHNGQTDLTGIIPFVWISNSHVHLRQGLAWEERWSRPRAMSSFVPLMRKMFRDGMEKPHCVRRDRGDADISEVARAGMIDRGVETAFICPLTTARAEFIGWVSVEYMRRETAPKDAFSALKRVERAAIETRIALTEAKAP